MNGSFQITLCAVFLGGCEAKEIIPRHYMGKEIIKCPPFTTQLASCGIAPVLGLRNGFFEAFLLKKFKGYSNSQLKSSANALQMVADHVKSLTFSVILSEFHS